MFLIDKTQMEFLDQTFIFNTIEITQTGIYVTHKDVISKQIEFIIQVKFILLLIHSVKTYLNRPRGRFNLNISLRRFTR